jgi:predicted TIM-barrel fold metal-dependent hydrolase
MERRAIPMVLAVFTAALGVAWAEQQQQQPPKPETVQIPPNSPVELRPDQRPRPGEGREPEWPVPRITEYKPRSTLVTAQHPTPRARFPVIDIHSHQPNPMSTADFERVVKGMEANNLRLLVNLSGGAAERLRAGLNAIRTSKYSDRMVLFANLDFPREGVGPGFGVKAAKQLEEDIKAGAKGLKIFKDLGLRIRRTDGSRLKLDDPELDPVWEMCARLDVPVLIHTAEPQEFFEPIDYKNERWLELALYSNRRYPPDQAPRFEELIGERDRMFAKHAKTRFIAAHFAYHANDLARMGKLLDRLPNVYTEVGAILAELGRQPRAAHDFFVKYQDRILFGKDSYQPDEYPYYWRTFETGDEYFDYYRDYHAFWKLYGMSLPDDVLKKLYYKNALHIVPGLPSSGFPN